MCRRTEPSKFVFIITHSYKNFQVIAYVFIFYFATLYVPR